MEVGPALRRRREALGYTLEDVQAVTKIRVRYLEAIEAERFGELPAAVYARGFVRLYGNFLELDGSALAAAWARTGPTEAAAGEPAPPDGPPTRAGANSADPPPTSVEPGTSGDPSDTAGERPGWLGGGAPAEASDAAPEYAAPARGHGHHEQAAARPPIRPLARGRAHRRRPILVLWLVAAIAAAAAVYAWQAARRGNGAPTTKAVTAVTTTTPVPATPATGTATAKSPPGAGVPALTATSGTDATGQPLMTYRVAGASQLTVTARASARCWVRVWLDGGSRYTDRTLLAGQTLTWHAKRQISLRIGYPSGLHLTIDGLSAPPLHNRNPVNATIVLGPPTASAP